MWPSLVLRSMSVGIRLSGSVPPRIFPRPNGRDSLSDPEAKVLVVREGTALRLQAARAALKVEN